MNLLEILLPEIRMSTFKDPILENEYMSAELSGLIRLIRLGMLVFGCVFLVFLIPDYLFNLSLAFKIKMTILRLALFSIILISYFKLPKLRHWKQSFRLITFCEFLIGTAFLYIGSQYETPNFMLQMLTLMLMQLVFFIIPNKLLNCVIVSFLTWALFIVNSFFNFNYVPPNEYLSGYIFPVMFMLAFSYWHIRLQVEKRIQFFTNQQLLRLLNKDPLTNIYNRFKFETDLNQVLFMTDPPPLTLTLLDIDFFKQINDRYGHLFGDRVLLFLTKLIESHLGPKDLFARWGGEEFVILFYDCSLEETITKVETIKASLETNPMEGHGCLTCSYGITELQPNDTLDSLVNRADQLMYQAKESGRNRIAF